MSDVLISGEVRGTPRTYGDAKNDDIWRTEIGNGRWSGWSGEVLNGPLQLEFEFLVNPASSRYGGNVSPHGPDVDTMVIGALDGLVCQRSSRPTLGIIEHRGWCRSVSATKTIVNDDELTGLRLQIRSADPAQSDAVAGESDFAFSVQRDALQNKHVPAKDRRKLAVRQAAESANRNRFRASRDEKIQIRLMFAEGLTRNPLSADWLEAVIDGLGASQAGEQRFFDGPPTSEYGYDDSVVYGIMCCQCTGLPDNTGIHIECRKLPQRNA